MSALALNSGFYFEDFEPGQKVKSAGRTVTEHDIATFAGLSGDFNQIHTDAEFARSTPFGQRIAHGLLGLAIASGLAVQTGILGANVIAFREVGEWKFVKPIFIGDTIHVDMEIMEIKAFPRLGGGSVTLSVYVNNQSNETTMKGQWTVLVKTRGQ
ncbi:MAG: MaoC/PaaZ C-terminal domain-containing protein [Chloroflexi bacterium]|nr:MaoC/PaaZ C-terminal domain-containing protein [Chloroflexota bacterium]